MMSDMLAGEVTKKLKEILGFKSLTHTSSALWRNKGHSFPAGTEDAVQRTKAPAGESSVGEDPGLKERDTGRAGNGRARRSTQP